ncbi:alpha/beta fold hydrolase [Flavobacteriales bacterium]|nr:alpha/beta fold hydrolase [Flavobacteriales bacterium]
MKLHYREYGEGQPMVILHGLFGSSDNWQRLGKELSNRYRVFLVDQRNHGHSPHSNDFSYELMSDDLDELLEENDLEDVILVGHSMGGKTAMTYAQFDTNRLAKLVVIDIGPKQYPMHHDTILEGLHSIDFNFHNTRGKCDAQLAKYVSDVAVRQFLLKNLYWIEKGQLDWRINLNVLSREMNQIIAAIDTEVVNLPTLFVRGELSNYILESDFPSIKQQFTSARIETISSVGHWVHAEAPQKMLALIGQFASE